VNSYTALVPRFRRVRVECLDENANPKVIEASGWYARILQHEIDHLKGTIYLDRMHTRSFMSLDNFTKTWKDAAVTQVKQELHIP
jgi:peptide deformylase